MFAISSEFDPADLLSSDLHNCHTIKRSNTINSETNACRGTCVDDILDVDANASTIGGRVFATLKSKQTDRTSSLVGPLVGVSADQVDENTCINDLINSFITIDTVMNRHDMISFSASA